MLRMKSKGVDPFKAMRNIQEQIDAMSEKWAERFNNLIDWMINNTPFSLVIVIATLSVIPIINLMYFWANLKDVVNDNE